MPRQFDRPRPRAGFTRRRLLEAASAMAATALAAPLSSTVARGQPRFASDPFSLGVASGDPGADAMAIAMDSGSPTIATVSPGDGVSARKLASP